MQAVPDVLHQDRKEKIMEKMPEIKIGGREIPLFYSVYETLAIQQEIGCTAFQLNDTVFGVEKIDEDEELTAKNMRLTVAGDPVKTGKLCQLIKILGNAGLEESGKEADLTEKWIMRNMKPSMIIVYAIAVMAVITDGNIMESQPEQKGPVDVIKEEIEAKKTPRD